MMLFCADSIYWGDFSGRVALQSDRLRNAQTSIDTIVAKEILFMTCGDECRRGRTGVRPSHSCQTKIIPYVKREAKTKRNYEL